MATVDRALVNKLTRELIEAGKIVEAGWLGFSMLVVSKDAPEEQRKEMRLAFFAGAQHLFSSVMSGGLEEGDTEATEGDLRRMDNINKELSEFAAQFRMRMQ